MSTRTDQGHAHRQPGSEWSAPDIPCVDSRASRSHVFPSLGDAAAGRRTRRQRGSQSIQTLVRRGCRSGQLHDVLDVETIATHISASRSLLSLRPWRGSRPRSNAVRAIVRHRQPHGRASLRSSARASALRTIRPFRWARTIAPDQFDRHVIRRPTAHRAGPEAATPATTAPPP